MTAAALRKPIETLLRNEVPAVDVFRLRSEARAAGRGQLSYVDWPDNGAPYRDLALQSHLPFEKGAAGFILRGISVDDRIC
jgi:hypothetical protein